MKILFARTFLPLLLIAVGFAGAVFTSDFVSSHRPALPESYGDSDLSMNGSRLKGFALGMEGLLADWYWTRALQYMGDKMIKNADKKIDYNDLRSINPHLLYPLLKNATDLDPHFVGAYSYGAIVLPAVDNEKAIEFAKAGIANNPNEWKLYQHLGYTYWRLEDYEKAADAYEKGAGIAGSSSFMRLMAASMRSEGGSRATARAIYRQMLAESEDDAVRITADRNLKKLDWFDERDAINKVLTDFREKNGRCSNSFGEVGAQLLQIVLPEGGGLRADAGRRLVDPTNIPYILDKEQCVVTLDREKTGIFAAE
jgi:tetratricopeptide (TPR) repeat protein